MDRSAFDRYLETFNARDYDAVLDYYAEPFAVSFAGYTFTTKDELRKFYAFFHRYVDERIVIQRFVSDATMIAMEANVRLEATADLTPEALAEQGLDRIVALQKGQVVTIPQFIHYTLKDGKITKAECVVSGPPF